MCAGAPFNLHAQLVPDGGTLYLKTSANLVPGDLIVGTNSGNTTLYIDSPGAVTNVAGYIGYKEACNNNRVTLRGTGAIWRNGSSLDIGYQGAFNHLMVTNSANVILDVQGGSPGGPYDLLTSTNAALPLADWTTNNSGIFDGLGNSIVTNGINPAESERYYRISVP